MADADARVIHERIHATHQTNRFGKRGLNLP